LIDGNEANRNILRLLRVTVDAQAGPSGKIADELIIKQTNIPDLWVLGTGLVSDKDVRSYESLNLKRILDKLLLRYPFIIIDGPPLNSSGESIIYASQADRVLVVVHAGLTRTPVLARALSTLPPGVTDKVEVVLNRRTFAIPAKIYNRL
jgi:Mrp family chromosome partitioning ATPase